MLAPTIFFLIKKILANGVEVKRGCIGSLFGLARLCYLFWCGSVGVLWCGCVVLFGAVVLFDLSRFVCFCLDRLCCSIWRGSVV